MTGAGYPREWEADVLLRDGHPVHLRPITPEDAEGLRAFHARLSARTVYLRFFAAKPRLTDEDVAYFTGVDHAARVALVAVDRDALIGVGRFDQLGDGSAEVAFIIRDDMQGQGLGSILLEHLVAAAQERGVSRFVAEVLPENTRMLATFREAGFALSQHREDDVIAVSFDISPTQESVAVMREREHRAEARSMARMLHPAQVAVVGASRRPGGLGHAVLTHLVDGGYTGVVTAVHPEVDIIHGVPCVRRLSDVDGPVDLAVVVVPAAEVTGVVEQAAEAGVLGLVVVSGGFGDTGPEGALAQRRLVETVHRTGMRLVGPNALGLMNAEPGVRMNASLVPDLPPHGHVGLFCQSGALGSSIVERFAQKGVGISSMASVGNRADVSGNDLLQYWEEDDDTAAIALHLETIGNARKFARLVQRIAQAKPVVMVRSGGTGRRNPQGHAVVASDLDQSAVDQVLGDCGLVIVDSVERMIDVLRVVSDRPLPRSARVAVVSNSDALAVLAENALPGSGLTAADTPQVFSRAGADEAWAAAVERARHDVDAGAVLAIHVPPIEGSPTALLQRAMGPCDCGSPDHAPVVAVVAHPIARDATTGAGVPAFVDVEDSVRALGVAWSLQRWRRTTVAADIAPLDEVPVVTAAPGCHRGDEAARLLTATGDLRVVVEQDATGIVGCDIRLVDDPLFGPVVSVAIDDPIAHLLGDRQSRLAPVSLQGAREMLAALQAFPVLTRGDAPGATTAEDLAHVVTAVSRLHRAMPGVVRVMLRHAGSSSPRDLTVGAVEVEITPDPRPGDPPARRL